MYKLIATLGNWKGFYFYSHDKYILLLCFWIYGWSYSNTSYSHISLHSLQNRYVEDDNVLVICHLISCIIQYFTWRIQWLYWWIFVLIFSENWWMENGESISTKKNTLHLLRLWILNFTIRDYQRSFKWITHTITHGVL